MDYSIRDAGNAREAHLRGRLTFSDHQAFRAMIGDLKAGTGREWVLDLASVEFIDSAGLGLLMILRESAESGRIALKLRKPHQQAARLFEVAKLAQLFTIEN